MPTVHKDKQIFEGGMESHASKIVLFDDFLGDVLDNAWSGAKGTDAQAVVPTITAAVGGKVRLTTGDTAVVAESAVSLTHGLNWSAASGGLVMEAKVIPVTAVTTVAYFIGFTDTLATTTLEEPITLSGTTFTGVTDAVGFVYDTAATTDVFYAVGCANGTETAGTAISLPVADTAITLRLEIDASGVARFWYNGTAVASIAAAVTAATPLTPCVEIMARTTSSRSMDVDYIYVAQDR